MQSSGFARFAAVIGHRPLKKGRIMNGKKLLLVVAAAVFSTYPMAGHAWKSSGHTWKSKSVPYYINPANADVASAAAITAIRKGADVWSSQSNADFTLAYAGQTTGGSFSMNLKNEVFFRNAANGSLVAETYRWYNSAGDIIDSDIVFYDGGWKFTTTDLGACSKAMVIENFAAHEFGHMLGLTHSAVTTATMYPSNRLCATNWMTLDPDDQAGVESLYPPSTLTDVPPTVSVSSPTTGLTASSSTPVTFTGSAMDREDGNVSGSLEWRSNIDGLLGTGGEFAKPLSPGDHTITASAVDSNGAVASVSVTVSVVADVPAPEALTVSAEGFFKYGLQRVRLTWSGATSSKMDIFRDGVLVMVVGNDGNQVDPIDLAGSATYAYHVCEHNLTVCSAPVSVVF